MTIDELLDMIIEEYRDEGVMLSVEEAQQIYDNLREKEYE